MDFIFLLKLIYTRRQNRQQQQQNRDKLAKNLQRWISLMHQLLEHFPALTSSPNGLKKNDFPRLDKIIHHHQSRIKIMKIDYIMSFKEFQVNRLLLLLSQCRRPFSLFSTPQNVAPPTLESNKK
jgi:hypothetical protein